MRTVWRRGSLRRDVFAAMIAGELVFAAVLGLTIGVFSAMSIAREHETAIRQLSATVAAGLMPVMVEQQEPAVKAQLSSILEASGVRDIKGISLVDSSGSVLARQGAVGDDSGPRRASPFSVLFEDQVVEQPVVVDGLRVASVRVSFAPPGLSSLRVPTMASIVVVLAVMLVSVPWTAWWLEAGVIGPLCELDRYAARIAEDAADVRFEGAAWGEIGQLQDSLRSMAEQLRDRDERLRGSYRDLSEAYSSLERAKLEIEELSTVKSNFVAVAAHEIRTPLSTIRLYLDLLEAGELGGLSAPASDAVAAISSSATRLVTIVSDLMDSALLERGLIPIEFGEVSLMPLLESAARDADMTGRPKGLAVRVEDGPSELVIHGDALRLRQVFDNLLSNALKYSPAGTEVRVRVRETAEWTDVEVADNGRGIPDGSQRRVFALFGRLDFGDSRDAAGLGLGLAISARIVEAHGGSISYRPNEDGQGTVFCVRLPSRSSAEARTSYAPLRLTGETDGA